MSLSINIVLHEIDNFGDNRAQGPKPAENASILHGPQPDPV